MPINIANDANSPVRITSPLSEDLLVESMTGEEELGRPFVYYLSLLSNNADLQFNDLIGKTVTVTLTLSTGERYFDGHITEFSCGVPDEGFVRYSAVIRPWFWLLTQTADCRIFQNMSVPDIIKQVFRDNGMNDFEDNLIGNYQPKTYCVQYRESDFNFVSRLMEAEGIYYYFSHALGKHSLVMMDDQNSHTTFPAHQTVSYMIGDDRDELTGVIDYWAAKQSVMPNLYASRDFNFETPKVDLLSKFNQPVEYSSTTNPEIYDYPGEYLNKKEGSDYAKIRLQEIQCQQQRLVGGGTYRGIAAGYHVTLENHFRTDQNVQYLVVSVSHSINNAAFLTSTAAAQEVYRCQAEFIQKKTPFRSSRITHKPVVQGPQTAIVVGPAGEEIHTDKYGRVKVQFHWDRLGEQNDNSSCWVRVSQVWAGTKWGAVFTPRIGQEVIVSFMEGDPDQPIITGRVYNADNMPPYTLPENKTQSGIKSRSTKDGTASNFNEIRMEDAKGEEELYIHAERNQNNVVENNESTDVGRDRTEGVGRHETITIGENRTESVGKNEDITIGENRSENVGKNETISIGESRSEDVGKNETINIGENQTINIGKNQTETVGKVLELTVGDNRVATIGKNDLVDVGKKLTILAGDEITIKTGKASIVLKKDGTITLKGKNLKLQGSGKIDVKASKAVTMKGSKIMQN